LADIDLIWNKNHPKKINSTLCDLFLYLFMAVLLTRNHIYWLYQSGFRFYVSSMPGNVGDGKPDIILHPFKAEREAIEFISNSNLRVAPIDFANLDEKSHISKAINESRCFLYDAETEK
jgi:hypothetical protein